MKSYEYECGGRILCKSHNMLRCGECAYVAELEDNILKLTAENERLSAKQIKKEITETLPGGGKCPSCDVRLIGKADYCGKCGQRIGWEVYGGNINDKEGEVSE